MYTQTGIEQQKFSTIRPGDIEPESLKEVPLVCYTSLIIVQVGV